MREEREREKERKREREKAQAKQRERERENEKETERPSRLLSASQGTAVIRSQAEVIDFLLPGSAENKPLK